MPRDVRQLVGDNVRRHRKAVGLSQAALAARLDVDRAYVSGLERGERNVTILSLWHIALALEVSMAMLVDESDQAAASGLSEADSP